MMLIFFIPMKTMNIVHFHHNLYILITSTEVELYLLTLHLHDRDDPARHLTYKLKTIINY